MSETIGSSVTLLKTFIEARAGPGAFSAVLDQLDSEEQRIVKKLLPTEWVPYPLFFDVLRAGAKTMGCELSKFCEEYGAFEVEHDIPIIYKAALKFGGPGLMVMEADQLWKRYHNSGHLKIFNILKNSGKARIEGHEGGGPLLCATVLGFIKQGLKLSGAEDLVVEQILCRYQGDDFCEFVAHWS